MKNLTNFKTRKNQVWRGLFLFLAIMGIIVINATAQVTITTNFTNNNESSVVTFNFQNPTATDVIITELGSVTSSTGITPAEAFYKTSAVNGPPIAINTTNGWTSFGTGTYTAVSNTTTSTAQQMLTGLSLLVPAGATYGICISTTSLRYSTLTAGTYTFPGGGCNIITGTNIGYGGTLSSPVNTPRGFIGYISFVSATACSGTPAPGNTISSANPICLGSNVTLSLQNPSSESGITYQWQSSPNNITYSNITGGNGSSYIATPTASTYFQCIVTCTNSGLADTSTVLQVTMNPPSGCYCASNATYTADEEIFNVTLGTLNNSSTCSTTGGTGSILNEYSDYIALPAPMLGQSTTVPFSITVSSCGTYNYTSGLAVFIDFNQNGIFTDPGEKVYTNGASANINCVPATIITGNIIIPLSATLGNTRMRIINTESSSGDAITSCLTYGYGETEDYTVNIVGPPSCIQPSALTATPADISADLSWNSNSSETSWDIQYGLSGFTLGTGTIIENVSTNPYTLTGLTANTAYQYYVLAQCSPTDSSFWSGPFNFTTACSIFIAPFVENFNTTAIPNCWTMSGPQTWLFTNTWPAYGAATIVGTDHTGTGGSFAGVDGSGTVSLTGITLLSPLVDVSSLTVPMLKFYLFNNNVDNADYQTLTVDVWDGAIWHNGIFTWGPTDNNATWQEIQLSLGGFAITGPIQVRFIVAKSAGSPFYDDLVIDDVTIEEAPTCPQPISLTASGISDVSANLGWTNGGSETAWDIQYGITGFVLGTGTIIQNANTNPYSLTGLTPVTSYQFYVLAQCSPTDSSFWTGPFLFTTLISACTSTPNAGTTVTTTDTVYTGQSFTLSLTGTTSASGLTYQWQSSPNNLTWANIPGATSSTYTAPETANTYYQCIVTCTPSGLSDTSTFVFIVLDPSIIMTTGTATVCSTNFYDSGGPTGTYQSSEDYTLTLFPATLGASLQVVFNSFVVEASYDNLTIYNGNSIAAPLIGTYYISPGTIQSTAADGSLTFVFHSDGSVTYAGWDATINCLLPCVGTPTAGIINAPASACSGVSFNLTLSGNTIASGITFQWQSSTDNITYSNISGATSANYTATQTVATYYQCIITCTASGLFATTASVHVLMNSPSNCYCTSNATTTADEEIFNVTLGTLNNSSTCLTTGGTGSILNEYSNYTAITPPNLNRTLTYPLSVQVGTCGGTLTNGVSVWIDYNQNGSFADAGERVYFSPTTTSGAHTETANISIPITATVGHTGMRVIVTESSVPSTSCGTYYYGETEDYMVNILPVPTCPQPTALTASTFTQTSAQLSWTNGGSETSWDIQYGLTGFVLGTGTIVNNVTTNPYTLNGLIASSEYQYYVSGQCSPTDSSYWSGPFTFSTLCGPTTALYIQKFDAVTAPAIPNCWSAIVLGSSGNPYVQTSTITPYSLPNCAQLFNSSATGSTTHILLIGPQFSDMPTHTTQIRFMARYGGSGACVLNVGTMSNPTNPNTFSTFQSITSITNTWQEFVVSFGGYMGSNQTIAFKHGLAVLNQNIYIDDVYYEVIPTCPKPLQITTSNITSSSIDINWNPGGTETAWDIEYGPTGFIQGTGTTVNVTAHPYTLSGLTNSTNYQFYIRAYCSVSDQSIWQGPYSFSTPACNPSEMCMHYLSGTDLYSDSWNGASVTVQQNGVPVKVFTLASGLATFNDSISLCNNASITLVWVAGSYPLECGFAMTDFYGYPVTSFATGSAPVAGTFFSFTGNCNPPSCPRVTNLTATNLAPTSADLSWTNGGAEAQWQIEYGIYGFIHGSGTFVIANTNPYILSSLSQGLSYSYYVRAICGVGDTSIWRGPYSFSLPCVPYTATYTQNFDAITAPNISLCWTTKIIASGAGSFINTTTTSPHSAVNCAELYNSSNTGATTHLLLVSPQFTDLTSHSTQVRFWAKGGSSLIVGTMTDPSNENTFTPLSTINNLNTATWQEYVVSFVGYNGINEHFAFKHGTTSTYTYVYIDDVVYEPAPANDISVTQVLAPNGGCGLSATENITCKIKNTGAAAQSNIPLGYKINGGVTVGPETFTGTLNPGDSAIYTFTTTADFTAYGTFTIKTFSMDITDLYHPNDTAYKTLISSALVNTFPYFDNFETANNYWTSGGTLNSWLYGTPNGTVINTAASGTKAWHTHLYNDNEASYVVGPCFDFTTLTNPFVRLKRWVNAENSWDGAALQSSIDGGLTWIHVGLLGDPTWYNDNTINGLAFSGSQSGWTGYGTGWVSSSHAIASLAGQASVKFRIVFGADVSNTYDGFAFDDFEIYEPSDVAIVYPLSGTYQQCGMSATDTITICVKNVGSTTIPSGNNIYTWYKVDLNTPVADTLTLTSNLMSGDSIFFNFSQTYNFSAYTTYLVKNWISYAGDYSTSNDSITTTQVNYQLTVNILGGDTILTDPNYLPYTMLLQGSPYVYETYFWSNFDGSVTGTANTYDAPALGWYYLTVTGGTCTAVDSVFLGDITNTPLTSISEGINVFPNPTHGKFIVEINSKNISDYKLELVSADGRIVNSKVYYNVIQIRETYNESKLAEGVYYLKITVNGKQQVNKIVIY